MESSNSNVPTNEEKREKQAKEQLYKQFSEMLYKAFELKKLVLSEKSAKSNENKLKNISERVNRLNCILAGTAVSFSETSSSTPTSETSDSKVDSSFVPSLQDFNELDQCIIDLTGISDTATIADIPDRPTPLGASAWGIIGVLVLLAIGGIVLAVIGFVLARASYPSNVFQGDSLLAASLGLLGAVAYSFFQVLSLVSSRDFSVTDGLRNFARLILGLLLGWVFYFAFVQQPFANFANVNGKSGDTAGSIVIFLPFLAGYSTVLVISILDRAIQAVILALGLGKSISVSRTNKSKPNVDQETT